MQPTCEEIFEQQRTVKTVVTLITQGFSDNESFEQRKAVLDKLLGEGTNHSGAIEYYKQISNYLSVWALLWKTDDETGDFEIGLDRCSKAAADA